VEALFYHVPGLKIVVPSDPYDAKGLLKAAIRDDDPVLFFEHKHSYRRFKSEIPDDEYVIPLGTSTIKRLGTDLSVITYGVGVHYALEAARELEQDDISVEILDLRCLAPLDRDGIAATIRKTNKALVLHEDGKTGGIGAEVSAYIAEFLFEELDGPVIRIAGADSHIPYAPSLESAVIPNVVDVVTGIRQLAAY